VKRFAEFVVSRPRLVVGIVLLFTAALAVELRHASNFALWRQLGAYVAIMMVTSALATLTLIPALVLIFEPRFIRKGRRVGRS
jgi:hypothetical protein